MNSIKKIIVPALLLVIAAGCVTNSENPEPTPTVTQSLDEAIHKSNLTQAAGYRIGELATEGHVILGTETNEKIAKVYTLSSYGQYGFENGLFTSISGAGGMPTVIIFSQNDMGEYVLQDYQEPQDGSLYQESIKKMFPAKFLDKIQDANYDDLGKQQEAQVLEYLTQIGRPADLSTSFVEKDLPKIDVEASNQLLDIVPRDTRMDFPYWLGTVEMIENGTRYIYETAQSKTDDGHDLMTYTKKKEDGTVIATYRYKIVGSSVVLQ